MENKQNKVVKNDEGLSNKIEKNKKSVDKIKKNKALKTISAKKRPLANSNNIKQKKFGSAKSSASKSSASKREKTNANNFYSNVERLKNSSTLEKKTNQTVKSKTSLVMEKIKRFFNS